MGLLPFLPLFERHREKNPYSLTISVSLLKSEPRPPRVLSNTVTTRLTSHPPCPTPGDPWGSQVNSFMNKISYSFLGKGNHRSVAEESWEPKQLKEHFKERKISGPIWRMERNINHPLITSWPTNQQLSRVLSVPPHFPDVVKEPTNPTCVNFLSQVKPTPVAWANSEKMSLATLLF